MGKIKIVEDKGLQDDIVYFRDLDINEVYFYNNELWVKTKWDYGFSYTKNSFIQTVSLAQVTRCSAVLKYKRE